MEKYRTHNCGELRLQNVGQEVRLAGWVNSIRELGGITFVTLRDHYGVTQALFRDKALLDGVNKESVVMIDGEVVERESKNANMETGEIEVLARALKILGKSKNVLPFEIADAPNTKEELRLKYRYLDLRNSAVHKNIVLRSELLHFVRNKMHELGFCEVQTPILTSSSPEGARDFLVPSRLNPGKFYALPQSPQQFKQLLMVSGFDKYFQIAPCFRDEDARADRSPGEFYQMDMEMSFVSQDEVMAVLEEVLYETMVKFTKKEVTKPPFERIKFKDAMERYCTDKPDLRNPLIVHDLSKVFEKTAFNAFKGKTVKLIVADASDKPRRFYDDLTKFITDNEGKGLAWLKHEEGGLNGSIVKFLSEDEKRELEKLSHVGESLFLLADEPSRATKLAGILRNELGSKLGLIDENKLYFCFIVDFPFFEYNEEEKKIEFSHNPFSMPQGGMEALVESQPLSIVAYQFDVVLNGCELASGAVRNHDPEIMVKAFEMAGYDKSVVENKFPALFNAFGYGAPPHAGAAFGFDRVLMFIAETNIIRDVIAFPFNKNAQDLLMNAPNEVTQKQLEDVSIKIDKKE